MRFISMEMALPESVCRWSGDDEPVIAMSRNRIAIRIGEVSEQAGLGKGFRGIARGME